MVSYWKKEISNTEKDGAWVSYYNNGKLWAKENYKDGISDGNLEEYSFGGQLRLKGNHINGKREGLWEWFNENGSYFKTETYKDGEKID